MGSWVGFVLLKQELLIRGFRTMSIFCRHDAEALALLHLKGVFINKYKTLGTRRIEPLPSNGQARVCYGALVVARQV